MNDKTGGTLCMCCGVTLYILIMSSFSECFSLLSFKCISECSNLEHAALDSLWCKDASKCTDLQVKFQKFSGAMFPDPHTGEGYPSPDPIPFACRHFAPTTPRSRSLSPPSSAPQVLHHFSFYHFTTAASCYS